MHYRKDTLLGHAHTHYRKDTLLSDAHITLLQAHDVESVNGVEDRHAEVEPRLVGLGDRLENVLTPGVLLVGLPRVAERVHHLHLSRGCGAWVSGGGDG